MIAGLGRIGMGYDLDAPAANVRAHARAFSRHPAFRLVAGIDPSASRREIFSREYGCASYPDAASALEHHAPDVLVVAVPTPLHATIVREALARTRPRAILCEKPLAADALEAHDIVQLCADQHVPLYVNYMRRSDPGVLEVRRRIETGELGSEFKGVAWYSNGFVHSGSHLFNLLEYWLGPAQISSVINPGRACGAADAEPDVHVVFERGAVMFLSAWEEAFSHHTIELVSRAGRLRYEDGGHRIEWQPRPADGGATVSAMAERLLSGMECYQWHVTEQLALALDGRAAHLCSGDEALRSLTAMLSVIGAGV